MAVRLQTDPEEIQILLRLAQANCMDILVTTARVLIKLHSAALLEAMDLECAIHKLEIVVKRDPGFVRISRQAPSTGRRPLWRNLSLIE